MSHVPLSPPAGVYFKEVLPQARQSEQERDSCDTWACMSYVTV